MKALARLTLLDVGLIAALILTGVLWYLSANSESGRGSLDDVDSAAWATAMENLADALQTGSLQATRSAIYAAADVAMPANDGAAEGLRTFADSLQSVELTAADLALGDVDTTAYRSPLFAQFYYVVLATLSYPPFPAGDPASGAEWTQANIVGPDDPGSQYWGTARWTLPAEIEESVGEADIAMPDADLTGKLMLADDGETMQVALVFLGPLAQYDILDIDGFWASDGNELILLTGTIASAAPGTVVMALAPEAREDNIRLLQNAVEIGIAIAFAGDRSLLLRVEIGDSGRSIIDAGLARTP